MKRIFSFGLYKNMMKQLWIPGIIAIIVLCVPAFFGRIIGGHYTTDIFVPSNVYLSFSLFAPVMTLFAFRFLFERDASDFYCSIPRTRFCIYSSYIAAIITWIAVAILSSTVIGGIVWVRAEQARANDPHINFGNYIPDPIPYKEIGLFLILLLICTLLVVSVFAFACCIGSSYDSAIILALSILILPSAIVHFINHFLSVTTPTLVMNNLFFLLDADIDNLVYAMLLGKYYSTLPIHGGHIYLYELICSYPKVIYTLILSCVWFILGGIAICRKKCEANAQNKLPFWLQTTLRCLYCFGLSLIPLSLLMQNIYAESEYEQHKPSLIFLLFFLAVCVYYLFEIKTMKSFKNILKITPFLLIPLIANLGMYGIIKSVHTNTLAFQLAPEEIEAVVFKPSDTVVHEAFVYRTPYLNDLLTDIRITDPEILSIVSSSLKKAAEPDSFYNALYGMPAAIYTAEGVTYRNISLTNDESLILYEYLYEKTDLFDKFLLLENCNIKPDTEPYVLDIYKTFIKEVSTLSFEDARYLTSFVLDIQEHPDFNDYQKKLRYEKVSIDYTYKGEEQWLEIPITPLTPDTYNLYLKQLSDKGRKYIENPELIRETYSTAIILHSYDYEELILLTLFTDKHDEFFTAAQQSLDAPELGDHFYYVTAANNSRLIGILDDTEALRKFFEGCKGYMY